MKIGIDIEETARFKTLKANSTFVKRYFSKNEIAYCFSKPKPGVHLAARFAAKEAFYKATNRTLNFKDIEVSNAPSGRPELFILGKKHKEIDISISHSAQYAVAAVLSEN